MNQDPDKLNFEGFINTKSIVKLNCLDGIELFKYPEVAFHSSNLESDENQLLGKRAERFFSAWIAASSEYEIVLENIQIFEDSITLGEFDFILKRQENGQLIHVELIYKFYLLDPAIDDEWAKWIGPNRNDNLKLKLAKLQHRQFPLLKSDSCKRRLADFNIDVNQIEQQMAFFGNLFLPSDYSNNIGQLNSEAIEGYWYSLTDLQTAHVPEYRYHIPSKKDWFNREPHEVIWMSMEELSVVLQKILETGHSPMVWRHNARSAFERLFVVWW